MSTTTSRTATAGDLMATILKTSRRNFQEESGKIDPFRVFTDRSIREMGIKPENLNFDLRQLAPGKYSAPYHFHRHAEELFMMISGSTTLRTPQRVGGGRKRRPDILRKRRNRSTPALQPYRRALPLPGCTELPRPRCMRIPRLRKNPDRAIHGSFPEGLRNRIFRRGRTSKGNLGKDKQPIPEEINKKKGAIYSTFRYLCKQ